MINVVEGLIDEVFLENDVFSPHVVPSPIISSLLDHATPGVVELLVDITTRSSPLNVHTPVDIPEAYAGITAEEFWNSKIPAAAKEPTNVYEPL
jgi:hypothetical protein